VRRTREEIRELFETGVRPAEIARILGIASSTVEYHLAAIRTSSPPGESDPDVTTQDCPPAVLTSTREQVRRLLDMGLAKAEIAQTLGITKSTVSYHARGLGEKVDGRCARRYDWSAIQDWYDLGHSVRECSRRFGFNLASWHDAVRRGAVTARPVAMPLDELLKKGVPRNRNHVKQRLVSAGVKQEHCESCGISEWQGRPLSLALHHVNGDRHDNRLENLRLLCPNCHSQTENFGGRNGRRVREGSGGARSQATHPSSRFRPRRGPWAGLAASAGWRIA
jgi:DNA-binding CsgD family transcriptional regulator